jgi:Tol biopolymer transport system component
MVTGQRAFEGATKMSTLSAILTKDPPQVSEMAASVPGDLQRLIARCLRKDPERRAQHMDDVKLALEQLNEDAESGRLSADVTAAHRTTPASRGRGAALAAGAVLLIAGVLGWWLKAAGNRDGASDGPILTRLTSDPGLTTDPAFSPVGNLFAYASDRDGVGGLDIWVKQIAGGDPIRLTHDPADDHEPAFSPDGSQIAFRSERQGGGIYVVSTLGGNERKLADLGRRPRFSPDGKWIAYWVGERTNNTTGKIFVIPVAGGPAVSIQPNLGWMSDPVWSPDSRFLLFRSQPQASGSAPGAVDWWVAPLGPGAPVKTGAIELLRKQGLTEVPVPETITETNEVVFVGSLGAATNIWQLPISPKTWKAEGPARRLTFGTGEETSPSLGKDGRLLFSAIVRNVDVWSLPADGNQGKATGELRRLTNDAATDDWPSISADGKVLTFASDRAGSRDVWIKDLATGSERRLTSGPSIRYGPRISSDGSQVAYLASENRQLPIYVIASGGGIPRKVCENCGYIWGWGEKGAGLTFSLIGPPWYISWLNLDSGQTRELIRSEHTMLEAHVSPDGQWIAFQVQKSTQTRQIFVAPFRSESVPGPSDWIPVTDGEGIDRNCYWSPDGNLLYYQSEREGYRCIFARHLDRSTRRPVGPPFAVYHSHHARLSLSNAANPGATSLSVARDSIVFAQGEITGNVWMAKVEGTR